MRPKSFLSTPGVQLTLVLCLGALGQWSLSRREEPWTLWAGLLFYLPALWLWLDLDRPSLFTRSASLPPRVEGISFFFILALAAFYRVYRLSEFPAGVFLDEACEGFGALRILHEGWRPFYEIYHQLVWDPPIYYLLALWFKFVSVSKVHFFLFSVVLSLLSFPFIYWTFRQLSGVRVALCALFVLAVMRWDITYSRDCHPAIQLPFYMFGTLAFFLYGTRERKTWALAVAGTIFAGGFYIYQAYKAFLLLMVLYIIYEWFVAKTQKSWHGLSAFLMPAFVLSSPIWLFWLKNGSLGSREAELFIFPGILQGGNLLPLWKHFWSTALMFNREGDSWFLHNLPYHRMLDDATGSLWLLGLAPALAHWKKREHFYAVCGLAVMCLPAFLSIAATHGSRAFGTVPFLALLAGMTLCRLWDKAQEIKPVPTRWVLSILLALVPGLMADQNGWTYFVEQADNYECWRGPSTDATLVGERIAHEAGPVDFYLSPAFDGHFSVLFLGYFQRDRMHALDLSGLPSSRAPCGLCFALEEGRTGVLGYLKEAYPGGKAEAVTDPWGHPIAHFYEVSPGSRPRNLLAKGGLKATYYRTPDLTGVPALRQVDPVVNFTFREDFPLHSFQTLSARWDGALKVTEPGDYRFLASATDKTILVIDGKKLFQESNRESAGIPLAKGTHSMELLFQKSSGVDTALSLAWKRPGAARFEVVPFGALFHRP